MSTSPSGAPRASAPLSRRALLRRTGLVAAVPVVVPLTGAGPASPAAAATTRPECLADLIEQGVVSRADLLA